MSKQKPKVVDLDADDLGEAETATLVADQNPKNKVEKAVLAGESVEDIAKANENADDPDARRQTDLEIAKLEEKQRMMTMENRGDAPVVTPQRTGKGWVKVNMYETIVPAPTVGTFSVTQELGIPSMLARQTYSVPKDVADVLVDARKAGRVD